MTGLDPDDLTPDRIEATWEDENGHCLAVHLYESWRGFAHDRIGLVIGESGTGETTSQFLLDPPRAIELAEWIIGRYGGSDPSVY